MGHGIPYVSAQASELGQKIEYVLSLLPSEIGILFIGVLAVPVPGGETDSYDITIGINRVLESRTVEALVHDVFVKRGWDRLKLSVKIARGVVGSSGHKAFLESHPIPT